MRTALFVLAALMVVGSAQADFDRCRPTPQNGGLQIGITLGLGASARYPFYQPVIVLPQPVCDRWGNWYQPTPDGYGGWVLIPISPPCLPTIRPRQTWGQQNWQPNGYNQAFNEAYRDRIDQLSRQRQSEIQNAGYADGRRAADQQYGWPYRR